MEEPQEPAFAKNAKKDKGGAFKHIALLMMLLGMIFGVCYMLEGLRITAKKSQMAEQNATDTYSELYEIERR